jgi:hypothetical protein
MPKHLATMFQVSKKWSVVLYSVQGNMHKRYLYTPARSFKSIHIQQEQVLKHVSDSYCQQ